MKARLIGRNVDGHESIIYMWGAPDDICDALDYVQSFVFAVTTKTTLIKKYTKGRDVHAFLLYVPRRMEFVIASGVLSNINASFDITNSGIKNDSSIWKLVDGEPEPVADNECPCEELQELKEKYFILLNTFLSINDQCESISKAAEFVLGCLGNIVKPTEDAAWLFEKLHCRCTIIPVDGDEKEH